MFSLPQESSNSCQCSLCLEDLSTQSVGAYVPCGHVMHMNCYESLSDAKWRAKCPMCKQKSKKFIKIFLDFGNTQKASAKNDDDEMSLDDDDDDYDFDEKEMQFQLAEHLNVEQLEQVVNIEESPALAPDNVIVIDDDADGDKKDKDKQAQNTDSEKKAKKYKRLALKYLKRLELSQSHQKKLLQQSQDLGLKVDEFRRRLQDLEINYDESQSMLKTSELELQGVSLELQKTKRKCQEMAASLKQADMRSRTLNEHLENYKEKLNAEYEKKRATNLVEFDLIVKKEYPKLLKENKRLRELHALWSQEQQKQNGTAAATMSKRENGTKRCFGETSSSSSLPEYHSTKRASSRTMVQVLEDFAICVEKQQYSCAAPLSSGMHRSDKTLVTTADAHASAGAAVASKAAAVTTFRDEICLKLAQKASGQALRMNQAAAALNKQCALPTSLLAPRSSSTSLHRRRTKPAPNR